MNTIPKPVVEELSLDENKKEAKKKVIKIKSVELSENIKKFDQKSRVATSPYDYNVVVVTKKPDYTPTADEMITDPVYNTIGKFLGVDTLHDWGKYSDKVKTLVEWNRSN